MQFIGPTEDRLAIRELLDTYSDAVCCVDAVAWGSTWAEDGVWELPDHPAIGAVQGRAQIVATWKEAMKLYPGIIFVTTPGSIVVDGERATVRCYTSEVYNDASGATRRDRGRYDDVVVKRNGRWLFLRRRFTKLHAV
jgi:ketosteroid isomerase-like protein